MINPLKVVLAWTTELAATGSAAPDLVWERYADPSRWVEWAPHLTSVTASTDRIRPGTTGVVRALGVLPAVFRITAVDAAERTWSWDVRVGPIRLHLDHDAAPVGDGCRAGLRTTGPAPIVLAYAPLASWALSRLVKPPARSGQA